MFVSAILKKYSNVNDESVNTKLLSFHKSVTASI